MAGPSLPPDMVLTYKQYKHDTEIVAGWLAEKSAAAGYKSETVPALRDKQPKLGAKARRVPRSAAEKAQRSKAPKPMYIVKTVELVEMAKCIAKARPKVLLSRAMQTVWEHTIRARREFSQWFRSKAATDIIVDEKHSHFASLLELALETLRPCYEPVKKESRSASRKKDTDKTTPLRTVTNIFQHLEVEDVLSEEELDQEGTTVVMGPQTKAEGPRARIDFDETEAESEFLFGIWSFMQEVFAVRIFVATTWRLYALGNIELMQAASVTNLAVDLVRRAEADLEASLQRPSAYPAAKYPTGSLPLLIFKLHLPPSHQCTVPCDPDLPMVVIICGCKICNVLLYIPWVMAKSYIHILKENPPTFPSSNNDFRVQVPPFPECSIRGAEFYHAQNPSQKAQTELSEILPNFSLLSLMLRGKFIEDEILHAARHILENHNVPIWVSLALQIQLDIQRIGEIKTIHAFADLKRAYEVTKFRAEEHQKWHASLEFEIWDKSWHNHVRTLVEDFGEWINGKTCGKSDGEEVLHWVGAGFDIKDAVRASGRVPLLEDFPVTCGTLKTELQLEWHTLGLKLVNRTAHVPMLCHLYNALRIVDSKSPVWPDMELLIRNQNPGKIFVGGRPGTLVQARNRFMLSVGVSAASLAKDARGIRFRKDNPGLREYEQSPIAKNLFDRWLGQETRKIDEVAYQLQELLFSRKYRQDLERNLYVTTSSPVQKNPHRTLPLLQTKMVRTLARLSEGFAAEMPAIIFDFFSMERRCFAMFVRLMQDYQAATEGSRRSTSLARNPAAHPIEITFKLFNDSVNSEEMVHCLASKNRADSRVHGPAMAKYMKSLMPQLQDENSQAYFKEALTLVRNGRVGDVFGEYADLSEYATASRLFKPVRKQIESVVKEQKGDAELVKLRRQVGDKDYGIFLFCRPSLEALYGSGKEQCWEDIVVSESVIKEAMPRTADNPRVCLATLLFLHREKIMCGTGEDSYEKSGLRSNDVKDLEREIREKWFSGKPSTWGDAAQRDKEDWEKWEGIYGREGRLASQRRKK
ncbi:uncharacterized protein Z520_09355 [Fonsecaea multimorphosa CBS 102226]|uniref:DUF6604 domain-containing protein n=1 Tax=Fonsecaea multimorphosa CBS 102226 TaxID=1442371 RepID=A0A0D2GZR7_9EURO|nr:uncharacterized protein Z520_09355 [Fonsecaea multimorphosa CBS 102226]KIX95045.1 hypothetical protein Z520_09355 [Fonsecaea multimorphosa CBS 102226]OAL20689.1 hypothetical protein AYO22_08698 [Fonsecaea multimorphosa]